MKNKSKELLRFFLQGLLYTAPIGFTVYFIYLVFDFADGLAGWIFAPMFGMHIPGLGLIFVVIFITLMGYFGESIIAEPFKMMIQKAISKTPFVNLVYTSIRDLFNAFVGGEKKFTTPVIVTTDIQNNIQRIGFITQKDLNFIGIEDRVIVYLPFSYAFTGEMLVVKKEQVKVLDISASDAMKLIVSGGVAGIDKKQEDVNNKV